MYFLLLLYVYVCTTIIVWFQAGIDGDAEIAYNIGLQFWLQGCSLHNLPWQVTASSHQVQCKIPTAYGWFQRIKENLAHFRKFYAFSNSLFQP